MMSSGDSMINASAGSLPLDSTEWKLPYKGKVAVLTVIATETALFTIFVVAYLFYIGKSLNGPYPKDVLHLPILATICLLSSSITIVIAERALEKGSLSTFKLWWFLTIALAAFFLGSTAMEWRELIYKHHLTLSTNLFGSTYYPLVGLHGSHVIVGLILLSLVWILSLFGFVQKNQAHRVQLLSWYWHFVDAVWIVVFTVVYVIGR
jgi:cytochrome c oxidase subunit 3/cytochrome o ubiquinol oxidase subunit 3